jgi:sugar phosphate isomerase/epimerase
MKNSRRNFILQSALAASALSLDLKGFASATPRPNPLVSGLHKIDSLKVSVFSKHLHWLDWSDMAVVVKEMGFDGIDLTVRPDGHVLPERVAEDLPKAVAAIRKEGLEVYMITTAITKANDTYTDAILKTAGAVGIKNYRLGWFSYNMQLSIPDNLVNFKKELQQLSQLNKKYKIHGDYQNHAGVYFGAPVIDLWTVLKDLDPEWIGCQYDIRHATVEGSNSWPVGFKLLKDFIKTINLKDFQWARKDGKWKEENVPLGTGMVDFKAYFKNLKESNFDGPVCLHYEYDLGGAEGGKRTLNIPKEEVFKAMKRDLTTYKTFVADAMKA